LLVLQATRPQLMWPQCSKTFLPWGVSWG
jgi:hypothetical protein